MKIGGPLLAVCAAFFCSSFASAQDSHYEVNQYGTRSSLMGGAVVGGVRDTSAAFYNPGALGFVSNESLSVSANAYKLSNLDIQDGAGDDLDLESEKVIVVPLLVSGITKFEGLANHTLGYSLLTRNRDRARASARLDTSTDILTNVFNPGSEDYIGQFDFSSDLTEVWGGISYAYKFHPSWSIGITNFLAYRNEESSQATRVRAVNQSLSNPFSTAIFDSSLSTQYQNLRFLWKIGLAGEIENVKVGLTFTTPSTSVWGDGEVFGDITSSNFDLTEDGVPESIVANDRQEGLDAKYKTPSSLALGVEFKASSTTTIGISGQHYFNQSEYDVLLPESKQFVRPIGILPTFDSRDFFRMRDGADGVSNFGVAVEQELTDKINGYVSFRTDRENQKSGLGGPGVRRNYSDWNLYHVGIGAVLERERSDLGIGIQYSFGNNDDSVQSANFSSPSETNPSGETGKSDVDFDSIAVILGYTYRFE